MLNDFARVGEMLDGVPQANAVEQPVETHSQQITFLRLQSLRAGVRNAGREDIDTDRPLVFLSDQFQKKAVGAPDFQQASTGPQVAPDDAQMVAECLLLRGFVRYIIDVFAALEVV